MSIILKQIKINCPKCGEYVWRNTRITYNLTTKQNEVKEDDPFCQGCLPRDFIEALKHAEKIIPLTAQDDKREVADPEKERKSPYDKRV
jgi:hypothetical protein